jgi:hypothetical protein
MSDNVRGALFIIFFSMFVVGAIMEFGWGGLALVGGTLVYLLRNS